MNGTEYVVNTFPWMDPNKFTACGASYGGYMVKKKKKEKQKNSREKIDQQEKENKQKRQKRTKKKENNKEQAKEKPRKPAVNQEYLFNTFLWMDPNKFTACRTSYGGYMVKRRNLKEKRKRRNIQRKRKKNREKKTKRIKEDSYGGHLKRKNT